MKAANTALTVVLWIVALGLAFYLYKTIQGPIEFNTEFNKRKEAVIERLKNIRMAQNAYMDVNDRYANNFDDLINNLKYGEVQFIKTIGDPNDSTVITSFDTIMIPVMESDDYMWVGGLETDSLRYIPYGKGAQFQIVADSITQQQVPILVYQVTAPKDAYLQGLDKKFTKDKIDLQVGSLTESSDAGNWE